MNYYKKTRQAFIGSLLLLAVLLINLCSHAQQGVLPKTQTAIILKKYAVAPFHDTLFTLSYRSGSFSAQERAVAITNRIRKLATIYNFNSDSLQLVQNENTIDIVQGEKIIIGISDDDAQLVKTNKQWLAETYKLTIVNAVTQYKDAMSFYSKLKRWGLVLLLLAVMLIIVYVIKKAFNLISRAIQKQHGKRFKGIRFKTYVFMDTGEHVAFLVGLNQLAKFAALLLVLFLSMPLLFSIFPQTERVSITLMALIQAPFIKIFNSIRGYLPNLIVIIVITIFFHFILRGLKFLKKEVEKGVLKIPNFHTDWANPTYQIIKVLVYAFVLVTIFPYLPGSGSPVFNGVTIFLGALLTFGSSTSLGNVVSGLALTYMRSFKDGDRVKIGDVTGDIVEKNLLVTRIRTIKNEVISIPNSNVLNGHAINFSKDAPDRGLILHTTITIGYDVPWKTVHELATKAALATNSIEANPAPFIYQTSLDDFYVSYQVNAYTRSPNNQASIYSELHQNILDQFNNAGVEILSPHYRALRDGNMMAAPAENIPKEYIIPAIRTTNVNN